MKRIMIKWSPHIDNNTKNPRIRGEVNVYDSAKNKPLAAWRIEIDLGSIRQYPQPGLKTMPPLQRVFSKRVDVMARTYHDGFIKMSNTVYWVK